MDFADFDVMTFDCYGTLIDWETGIVSAVRPVFNTYGCGATDDEILEAYAGVEEALESAFYQPYADVLVEGMRRLCAHFDVAPTEVDRRALLDSIGEWPAFPDTVTALRSLHKTHRLGLISNIDDELFAKTAQHLKTRFDALVTAQQAGAYKPSHKTFEFALAKLDYPRTRVLHVAQSLYHDVAPARELGLPTVWVNRRKGLEGSGATPRSNARPDLEVASLAELADLVG